MRLIIVFAIAALAVAGFLPRYMDRIASHAAPPPAANAVQTVAPQPTYSGGPRPVVIQRDARGHFTVDGVVDGRRIPFMVDTGASMIALPRGEAGGSVYHPALRI